SRGGPDAFAQGGTHDPWRGRTTHLWQTANPDLRMAGPSGAWITAFNASAQQAREGLKAIATPTLLLAGDAAKGCRDLTACQAKALAGGGPMLELERDPVRSQWLAAIDTFIRERITPAGSPQGPHESRAQP
ncbi:MAG TPA: hypothetical protein VF459_05500, partial [Caulobacteraceae bacterium]